MFLVFLFVCCVRVSFFIFFLPLGVGGWLDFSINFFVNARSIYILFYECLESLSSEM